MPDNGQTIKPKFHHVNLKTTRLDEMIDWSLPCPSIFLTR